jgi:phosphoribosylanthranilate isomerase
MKIKICGITRFEDARLAVDAGADLLGFNFYAKSPRYISPISAARLIADIRAACSKVQMVGVFVNSSLVEINTITGQCELDLAQLCGDEPPDSLDALDGVAFKALRPKDRQDLARSISTYRPRAGSPAYLVDAYRPGAYGGTGQIADWSLARSLAEAYPLLLAGGLTPDNVAEAIRQVGPWGVDVASGVEESPGCKDPARLAAFIKTARESRFE